MKTTLYSLALLATGAASGHAALVWTVGDRDTAGRQVPEIANIYATTGTTTFIQETGSNTLPGSATTPAVNQSNDDDFYFPGVYTNVVDGGAYTPLGTISSQTDLGVERAITNGDLNNRYHFNFDASHASTDLFTVSFGMLDNIFDDDLGTGTFDIEILVNGVSLGTTTGLNTAGDMGVSSAFTLADVGGTAGAPDDNYVELRGTANDGARWQNFDYIRMDFEPVPEPSAPLLIFASVAGLAMMRRRRK